MKDTGRIQLMQSGVIPYRLKDNRFEMMIVTTAGRNGWTIPKGHIEPGYSASASACKEAFEEAGILGDLIKPNIGTYTYDKYGRICCVKVFLLKVTKVLDQWPEQYLRTRKWASIDKASRCVSKNDLSRLIYTLKKRTF